MKENMIQFKLRCKAYLSQLDINRLRAYGRSIGVESPTKKNKEELIDEIIAILSGELAPVKQSNRGAPVKNDQVDQRIPAKIEEIKADCFKNDVMIDIPKYDFEAEYQKVLNDDSRMMRVADPQEEARGFVSKIVSRGQVMLIEGEYYMFPVDCTETQEPTPIPLEIIEAHQLREGDCITCYNREKDGNAKVAVILSVNDVFIDDLKERRWFDDCGVCHSKDRIAFFKEDKYSTSVPKYIDWLMPITKGQRACIIAPPKAGKTKFLMQLVESAQQLNRDLLILTLLVDQSHETVGEFRRVSKQNSVFYTTYEDEADRQVFVAEFLLKRAKRLAEAGKDVLIAVDSLSALARAFNDTDASSGGKMLACGLETKTVHYIKKYFGSARCLEGGGSITIIGTACANTGDPADDVLVRELSDLATLEVYLSNELAIKRVYPAIDFAKGYYKYSELFKSEIEEEIEFLLRNELLATIGSEGILKLLSESNSFEEFSLKVKKMSKKQ